MTRSGSLDRLSRVSEPTPRPRAGEVLVSVKAVGLNLADVFACLGLYSATPRGSFIPGLECAGEIADVGPGVTGWRIGQRVMALTRFGGYATALTADTRSVRALPDGWSVAEGAAFPVQALTAWYGAVVLGDARAGSGVLLHSAAGGVGLAALRILGTLGARVVCTVGRESKREFLSGHAGLATDQIIVRDRDRFGRQLDLASAALGIEGFDLVLDAVMGPYFRPGFERLRPAGRYVVYGAADLMPRGRRPNWPRLAGQYLRRARLDPMSLISDNRSVMGFNLIWLWNRVDDLPPALEDLLARMPGPPHVGERFPFAEAPAALRALQSGRTVGKVVLDL